MFPSPVVPSPPPQWYGSIQGGGPWPPPPPTGGGGLVGRLAPVCARRCGRVCGAVRVMRCNAICSFCSTRQVAALSQLTLRDATTQFVVCSATTKCQPSALQRASGKRTLLATPAGGVGTMVAGGFAVTLCHHSPHPPFPQGGGGGWEPWTPPPIPQGGGGLVGSHCATFPTEHDHWGGVGGGGAKEAWNIYIYIYISSRFLDHAFFLSFLVLFFFTGGLPKTKFFATIPRVEMIYIYIYIYTCICMYLVTSPHDLRVSLPP